MVTNSRLKVFPAILMLALVACEDSITGIPDPVVEAVEAVALMVPTGPCVRPGIELISWWTGDGDFLDFQGVNPIASNANVSFAPGVRDQGFSFGGSFSQIEINDSPSLQPAVFTVDLWAERNGSGANRDNSYGNILIEKALDDMSLGAPLWSYFIGWRDNGHIAAAVYFDNDPGSASVPQRIVSSDAFLDADGPIFIALTVDGPANAHMVTLYVNGGVQGTFDATGLGSVLYGPAGKGSTVIGANYSAARNANFPRTFQGIIDEAEIFSSALTQEEIQAIYAGGKCKTDNEAPIVDPVTGGPVDEGSAFETSVSFTDGDSDSWTAEVDYGNGTVKGAPVTGTSVGLSHTYVQDGTYPVTVTVTAKEGAERVQFGFRRRE